MGLDIAVDLGGFTEHARPAVFALRVAPLQVSYIGYLGTMAANYMDYLICDSTVIPPASRPHYAEKLIVLPSYQVNDTKRCVADRVFTRQELSLPRDGCVYCCFNASYKISPATFAAWMRILTKARHSVLLLYVDNDTAAANLRREAQQRGVAADRLVFAGRLPYAEYLARYGAADLFLDTLPYNAGATASDALWAGLPVLTCLGDAFAGRVAASLLTAIELPELIARTQTQYEQLAVDLAADPVRLAALRARLAENRSRTRLFDTRRFVDTIEAAYTRIHDRQQANLPPCDIEVRPA